jgi:uncharacterized protein (TIGR00369 family)
MSLDVEIDRYCFVCGPDNPSGLQAAFTGRSGKAVGSYHCRDEHRGYVGISHGGVLAALLDEAMVYAAVSLGKWVTTAELNIRYSRPAPVGATLSVAAEVTRHHRRLVECRAEIRDAHGVLLAAGTGKLMQGRALRDDERAGSPDGSE